MVVVKLARDCLMVFSRVDRGRSNMLNVLKCGIAINASFDYSEKW